VTSPSSDCECLSANQISSTYINSWLRYNYFRFGKKQTAAILKFYCRFPLYHRNWHAILHQAAKFHPNETIYCGNDVISNFQDDGRSILLPVSYLLMSLPSESQSLSPNQILSTCLDSRLRYIYFRFWKINVLHIWILLSVSTLTTSPNPACYSASGYRISCKLEHTLRKYDVMSFFSRWWLWPLNTTFGFVFVNVTAFRRSKSISKPNFVDMSQLMAEI